MKAVVVEIKGKHAVVLSKSGEFIKVRNTGNLNVGYEVDIPSKVIDFNIRAAYKIASIAAILIMIFGVSFGVYSYNLPYSYVNVDINPSLEITVNMYNRIIDVKALNTDGEKLLHDGSYKNYDLNEGVKNILESAVEEGYIKAGESNAVMLTVAGQDSKKVLKIQEEVANAAKETLKEDIIDTDVIVENLALKRRDEAQKLGISPGKLLLIEKLKEVNPEVNAEEYKDRPVGEIMKSIKDKREEKEKDKDKDRDKDRDKDKDKDKEKEKGNSADNDKDRDEDEYPSIETDSDIGEKPGLKDNKKPADGEKDKDRKEEEKDKGKDKEKNNPKDKEDDRNEIQNGKDNDEKILKDIDKKDKEKLDEEDIDEEDVEDKEDVEDEERLESQNSNVPVNNSEDSRQNDEEDSRRDGTEDDIQISEPVHRDNERRP